MDVEDKPTAEERIVFKSGVHSSPPDLRLLHFNDGRCSSLKTYNMLISQFTILMLRLLSPWVVLLDLRR